MEGLFIVKDKAARLGTINMSAFSAENYLKSMTYGTVLAIASIID